MRLCEWLAVKVPRKMALAVMSIAGLWGMRTPPEPEVTAQMAPARGPEGKAPPESLNLVAKLYMNTPRGSAASTLTEPPKKLE